MAPVATAPRFRLGRRPPLDGVRGLAVLAVMAFHANITWMRGGYLGVDAFFVLSGFLITALLVEEWQERSRIDLGAFWARRALRLLPAVLVVIGGVCLYAIVWAPASWQNDLWKETVSAVLYVSNWFQAFADRRFAFLLSHAWSLSIEEQFYVVWPLALFLALKARVPLRVLAACTLLLAVGSAWEMQRAYGDGGALQLARAYYSTDTRAQALLVGVALGLLAASGALGSVCRLARGAFAAAALVAAAGVGTMWVRADRLGTDMYHGGYLLGALLVAVVVASVVVAPASPLARVLSFAPLRGIGRISYGLYLWHWPVFLVATPERLGGTSFWTTVAVRFGLAFAFSLASWFVVERPVLAWKRRFERARPGRRPVPPARPAPRAEPVPALAGAVRHGATPGGAGPDHAGDRAVDAAVDVASRP